jgi:hypothetical protein
VLFFCSRSLGFCLSLSPPRIFNPLLVFQIGAHVLIFLFSSFWFSCTDLSSADFVILLTGPSLPFCFTTEILPLESRFTARIFPSMSGFCLARSGPTQVFYSRMAQKFSHCRPTLSTDKISLCCRFLSPCLGFATAWGSCSWDSIFATGHRSIPAWFFARACMCDFASCSSRSALQDVWLLALCPSSHSCEQSCLLLWFFRVGIKFRSKILVFPIACGFLQVEAALALEPSDQKALVFLILLMLFWWFLGHVRKVFGELCEKQWIASFV